jgi:hypothetical protein
MSVAPVRITSDINFAADTALSKNNNTTYFVQNVSTGATAVSQPQEPTLNSEVQVVPIIAANGGVQVLDNPAEPGVYALLLDFGAAAGPYNLSCVVNYGLAGGGAGAPYRWVGGAEASILAEAANAPTQFMQVASSVPNGQTLIVQNYTAAATPAGLATFIKLGANTGFY